MGQIGLQQLLEAVGLQLASHRILRARYDRFSDQKIGTGCGAMGQSVEQLAAGFASHLDKEFVARSVDQLGQRKVETSIGLRSRPHRSTETGASGLPAVDGDDKGVLPPNPVSLIAIRAIQEDTVLDGDGVEFASAHADESKSRGFRPARRNGNAIVALARGPQRLDRRVQELLPGVGTDGKAEKRIVLATLQMIAPGVLTVGPACRQVPSLRDLVIDYRPVTHSGTQHPIVAGNESLNEFLERLPGNHRLGALDRMILHHLNSIRWFDAPRDSVRGIRRSTARNLRSYSILIDWRQMLLIQINKDCHLGSSISLTQAEPAASWFLERSLRSPKCRLLCRRGSKFLERAQEGYGVFPAQHADDMPIPDDGHLVDSIAVHLLERGPQLGIWIDAF